MAELLRTMARGPVCTAWHPMNGDQTVFLRCDLRENHPGPLHYDAADQIWWHADA